MAIRFQLRLLLLPFLTSYLYLSCAPSDNSNSSVLTNMQKSEIDSCAHQLVESINNFDFAIINQAWNNKAFKERFTTLSSAQQSVFDHIFKKDIERTIKVGNLAIIHTVNENQGTARRFDLQHFEHHSELTILLEFSDWFSFFKYRFEHVGGRPVISDYYQFTDDLWYSEKMLNALKMNSKYKAFSTERTQANQALLDYRQYLQQGDSLSALQALYNVPETHQSGNWLSLKKLNLANTLNDSIYAEVLAEEYATNRTIYIQYLYSYYVQDAENLKSVYDVLASELGESEELDSLVKSGSFWR